MSVCGEMQRRLRAICEDLQQACQCCQEEAQETNAEGKTQHEITLGDFIMKRPQTPFSALTEVNGTGIMRDMVS